MDNKVNTCCLMTSRRIQLALKELASQQNISNDRQMAVVAGLKLLKADYLGVDIASLCQDLATYSEAELAYTARQVHPLLCSLKLEKWLGVTGQCRYVAESIAPRGGETRRILLDSFGREIRAEDWREQGQTVRP